MTNPSPKSAVVLVDPYNDFLHPDGKLTKALTDMDERETVQHLRELVAAARAHHVPIYYGLHQQVKASTFTGWKHMTAGNLKQQELQFFAAGTFGAEVLEGLEPDESAGDVIVSRHWNHE